MEGVVQSPTDKPEGDLFDPNLLFLSEAAGCCQEQLGNNRFVASKSLWL